MGLKKAGIASFLAAVFAAAAAVPGEAASAPKATPQFNRQAVTEIYGSTCAEREADRKRNIRPSSARRTAPEFRRGGSDLVIFSRELTAEHKNAAQDAVNSLPRHVMDLFYPLGGVAIFTEKTLTEALTGYRNQRVAGRFAYLTDYVGLYLPDERRVLTTFNMAEAEDKNKDGVAEIKRYTEVTHSRMRNFHHEVGHFIDYMVGGSERISNSAEFTRRITLDLNRLVESRPSSSEIGHLSYFLPRNHNGAALYGSKPSVQSIRKEVFAELWAEVQGHGLTNIEKVFPHSFAFVQALNQDLKRLHDQKGRHCSYEGYNYSR